MNEQLQRLLEAHVQHELASWQGAALERTLTENVAAIFNWLAKVKVEEVVTPEQIRGVISRYVIELRLNGGIPELSGEMSRLVFRSQVTAHTRVDEILAPESFEDFANKLISLDGARRKLIALTAQSATFASISARMLARSLLDLIGPRIPLSSTRLAVPFVQLTERLGKVVGPQLEQHFGELISTYVEERRVWMTSAIEQHLVSVLNPERLRALLDDLWEVVGPMRLAEAFAVMGEQDIEDFVVLIHEFWLRYRKTDFFRRISSEMVDHFFVKYGPESISSLIEDMGVDERMVRDELLGFLTKMLAHAADSGDLEKLIRLRLTAFYESSAAAAALG